MENIEVTFIVENIRKVKAQALEKENLLEVARRSNVIIDSPCNGNVTCGKCKVKVTDGKVKTKKTHHITDEEWNSGIVLACHSEVIEDITVFVPDITSLYIKNLKVTDVSSEKEIKLYEKAKENSLKSGIAFENSIKKIILKMPEPTLDDNISDYDRLKREMKLQLGIDKMKMGIYVLRKLPLVFREDGFRVILVYIITGENSIEILDIFSDVTDKKVYGAAFDIGTTSVSGLLIDLETGDIVEKASAGNAQIGYGADVINRIIYSTKKKGLERLRKSIIEDTINIMIEGMTERIGLLREDIYFITTSGNTTMTHLMMGVYPDYLRQEPYIPGVTRFPEIKARDLDIKINPEGYVFITPNVANYVGGDITSGVFSTPIWHQDEMSLFIDLGTNGEIVFGNKDFLMTCACSAGPAFEGGEISCGVRAADGAIEKIKIDKETLKPQIETIEMKRPTGVCGSGIIDLISEMFDTGIIDSRGKIKENIGNERIRFDENNIGEYVILFKGEYGLEKDITITDIDIDNFIRAKGAVYSAARVLVRSLDMDMNCIEKIYIAGNIGNSISIENSIHIGMFPDVERDKYIYAGNSSLLGAYMAINSKDARKKIIDIANSMTYVELSVYPSYMDEFMSACFIPHTDISLFPSYGNNDNN